MSIRYGRVWKKGNKQYRYAYAKIGKKTYKAKMVRDFARGSKKGVKLGQKMAWTFVGTVALINAPTLLVGAQVLLRGGAALAILEIMLRLKHGR